VVAFISEGRGKDSARKLAARASDPMQRPALEALFPGAGTLEARLDAAYRATEGNQRAFDHGPPSLFVGAA